MSVEGGVPGLAPGEMLGSADREGICEHRALLRIRFPVPGTPDRRFAIGPHTVTIAAGTADADAGVYEARVIGCTVLRESLGSKPFGGVVLPDLSFEIARQAANREAAEELVNLVNAVFDATDYAAERIEVWLHVSKSDELSAATLRFHGEIGEDGVEITSDRLRFRATDWLARYDRLIPRTRFNAEKDETGKDVMDPELNGEPQPLLYGDWTDRGSYFALPAAIVDRRVARDDGDFALTCQLGERAQGLACPTLGPVAHWQGAGGTPRGSAAWRGKFVIAPLQDARFMLARSQGSEDPAANRWEKGDEVFPISARGRRDARTGELLEEPALIARDLLANVGGVPEERIGASFDAVVTGFRFRAWLDRPRKLITEILADLCRDAGLVLAVRAGRFEIERSLLLHWEEPYAAAAIELDAARVLDGQRHKIRPAGWTYDAVELAYRRIPRTKKCERTARFGSTNRDAATLRLESDWVWRELDALEIAGALCGALRGPGRQLEVELPGDGLGLQTNRRARWRGDGLAATTYYVWDCQRDFAGGATVLRLARRRLAFDGGVWAAENAPDFSEDLPAGAKERWGWWVEWGDGAAGRWSRWRTR